MRPYTEEPGAEQFARPVLDWRRRGRPLRRPYGKKRALGIPVMKCRAMQALYLLALDPVAETTADPNSYGFRRGRSTADAIEACFIALCRNDRAQWILEGDIRSCFDRISHEWLLTHIPMDKVILAKWLKTGYLENRRLFPTEEGTPQGGICSPVIANMALDGLERLLAAHFPKKGSPEKRAKVNLIRYADDFCITGASKELLEQEVKPLVEQFLSERELQLSSEKTVITHIEQGFDFLGQTVRKYQKGKEAKFFITPSKKNVKAFLAKIRKHIKKSRDLTAGELIAELNPQIRGWALYHRHVGELGCLSCGQSRNLQSPVGLGATETPPQNTLVDQGQILAIHWTEPVGVHRSPQGGRRADQRGTPALRRLDSYRAAHE